MTEPTPPDHPDRAAAHPTPGQEGAFVAGVVAGRNRGLLLLVGTVTVVAGLLAVVMPFVASLTATILLGGLLVATGAIGLVTVFRRRDGWDIAAAFALALVSVVAGVLILAQPLVGVLALATMIIAYFAATGLLRLYYGGKLWGHGGGWMILGGAVSLALAILLWFGLPYSAAWLPGLLLGVDLLLWGSMLVVLALRSGGAGHTRGDAAHDPHRA